MKNAKTRTVKSAPAKSPLPAKRIKDFTESVIREQTRLANLPGAKPVYVTLREPDWSIDEKELARAFNKKTAAIVLNTPHNPTGKVFTRAELELIARLCQKWGALVFSDEIYEHILYDGAVHV